MALVAAQCRSFSQAPSFTSSHVPLKHNLSRTALSSQAMAATSRWFVGSSRSKTSGSCDQ